jgi:hypothetical protein
MLCASVAASAQAAAPGPPTTVEGVVVPGGPPPKVAASYPADGAAVPAGTLVLKIVFNQAMTADGWSYGQSQGEAFPHCLARPRLLGDQRTFVLLCSIAPHSAYAIEINAPPVFKSAIGRSAKPTVLRFSTTETGPRDIHDALVLAGLTDVDDPIMTWHDSGAGVSQSAPAADESDAKPNP